MSDKLLPCPFCGGPARVLGDDGKFYAICVGEDCYAAIGERYDSDAMPDHFYLNQEGATAAWNTRSNPSHTQLAAARSALEKIAKLDVTVSGVSSEDSMEWDGPYAKIANAALSSLAQEPAGQSEAFVRALDWQETVVDRGDGSTEPNGWEADSGFGLFYSIEMYFGSDSFGWQVKFDSETIGDADDPSVAKAIAQKDFERRAKSILTLLPAGSASPGVTGDVERLRGLVDWAYLHATEGQTWPSTKTADELISLAKQHAPTQSDADAFRSSAPAHPTVKVSGDADPDEYFRDPMFNKGVLHCQDLLGQVLGNPEYYVADGSEDYDTDLSNTLVNMLAAAGCYDKDEGKLAQIVSEASGDAAEMRERAAKWHDDQQQGGHCGESMSEKIVRCRVNAWHEASAAAIRALPLTPEGRS